MLTGSSEYNNNQPFTLEIQVAFSYDGNFRSKMYNRDYNLSRVIFEPTITLLENTDSTIGQDLVVGYVLPLCDSRWKYVDTGRTTKKSPCLSDHGDLEADTSGYYNRNNRDGYSPEYFFTHSLFGRGKARRGAEMIYKALVAGEYISAPPSDPSPSPSPTTE